MSKFAIYTDKNHDFRWKFIANNEAVIARSSEGFRRREDCLASLALLQKDIPGAVVIPDASGPPAPRVVSSSSAPAATTPAAAPSPSAAPTASSVVSGSGPQN